MEAQPAQAAYDAVLQQIHRQGGRYSSWYCGIASDWADRLFNDHKVTRKGHWYIARQCFNDSDARSVERALLELGCKGGGGGGDRSTVFVYAYLMGPGTNP